MDLSKYYDSNNSGAGLPPGWHDVTIGSYKEFQTPSGTPGVKFRISMVEDPQRSMDATFWTTEKAKVVLARFAVAAGYPVERLNEYEHNMLMNMKVQVKIVINSSGYSDCVSFAKVGEDVGGKPYTPATRPHDRKQEVPF
jgi:hypothetical protein